VVDERELNSTVDGVDLELKLRSPLQITLDINTC
jgi:hypothetical protein